MNILKKYQDKFLKIDLEDLTENYKDVKENIFILWITME